MIRAWRLNRARRKLEDAEWYFNKWVRPFREKPSYVRAEQRRIERLRAKVDRLGGTP